MSSSRSRILIAMLAAATLAAGSNLLLRFAMRLLAGDGNAVMDLFVRAVTSPYVLVGLFGYGLSHLLWLNVLSQARLGATYPVFVSTMFVLVLAGSVALLGEPLSMERLSGAILVAVGIVVAEYRRRPPASEGAES